MFPIFLCTTDKPRIVSSTVLSVRPQKLLKSKIRMCKTKQKINIRSHRRHQRYYYISVKMFFFFLIFVLVYLYLSLYFCVCVSVCVSVGLVCNNLGATRTNTNAIFIFRRINGSSVCVCAIVWLRRKKIKTLKPYEKTIKMVLRCFVFVLVVSNGPQRKQRTDWKATRTHTPLARFPCNIPHCQWFCNAPLWKITIFHYFSSQTKISFFFCKTKRNPIDVSNWLYIIVCEGSQQLEYFSKYICWQCN